MKYKFKIYCILFLFTFYTTSCLFGKQVCIIQNKQFCYQAVQYANSNLCVHNNKTEKDWGV